MNYTIPPISNQQLKQNKPCIVQAKILSPEEGLTHLYNLIDDPGISKLIVDGVEIPLSEAQRENSNAAYFNLTPGYHDVQYYIKPWPWNGNLKGKLAIGGEHFAGIPIRQITLPDNLEAISGGTFSYPFGQQTLEIPASVKEIYNGAFNEIDSNVIIHTTDKLKISSGSLPSRLNGNLTFLGTGDIEITGGNRYPINGNLTFDRQNITFNSVFGPVLGEEINFGNGNITFESNTGDAFWESAVKRIIFGDGNVIMRNSGGRFNVCSALETVTFGNGDIEIDDGNFMSCTSLKKIDFGKKGNLTIGGGNFNGLPSLEEIRFPNGLTTINRSGNFSGAPLLKSVKIPNLKTAANIGFTMPFSAPTDLEIGSANILGAINNTLSNFTNIKNLIIHRGKIGNYAFANNPLQSLTLEDVEIGGYAFTGTGAGGGYEAKLSNGITKIGIAAFAGAKLTKINIPTTLKEIPTRCFQGTWLTEVEIPASVAVIGASAFNNTPIGKLILNNGLKRIETHAFNHTTIFDLVIPETVEYIGQKAFSDGNVNYYLTNLTINMKQGKIDSFAFQQCVELQNLTIYPGVEELGYGAFQNAADLIKLHIPGTVKKIGDSCFYNFGISHGQGEIILEEGIKRLESNAFYRGVISMNLILPNSIEYLGSSCLPNIKNTDDAKIITYNPNPPERGGSMNTIYVPSHLASKYSAAGYQINLL